MDHQKQLKIDVCLWDNFNAPEIKPSKGWKSVNIQFPPHKPEINRNIFQHGGISNNLISTSSVYQTASTLLKLSNLSQSKALESVNIQLPPEKCESNRISFQQGGHLGQLKIDFICFSDNLNASEIEPTKTVESICIQLPQRKSEINRNTFQHGGISSNLISTSSIYQTASTLLKFSHLRF